MLGRVEAVGLEPGEGLELLAALAGLLERLRERTLLPAAAGVVQALELLLLGADQLVELRLAVPACAVACRIMRAMPPPLEAHDVSLMAGAVSLRAMA